MLRFFRRKKKTEESAAKEEASQAQIAENKLENSEGASEGAVIAEKKDVKLATPATHFGADDDDEPIEVPGYNILPIGESGLAFTDDELKDPEEKKKEEEEKKSKAAEKVKAKKASAEAKKEKSAKEEKRKPSKEKEAGKKPKTAGAKVETTIKAKAKAKAVELEKTEAEKLPKVAKEKVTLPETQKAGTALESQPSEMTEKPEAKVAVPGKEGGKETLSKKQADVTAAKDDKTQKKVETPDVTLALEEKKAKADAKVAVSAEKLEEAQEQAKKEKETPKKSWFSRLKDGLSKSSRQLNEGLSSLISKRKLDDDTVEELEELLITSDLGASTATKIAANIAKNRYDKEIDENELREALADEITGLLEPVAKPMGHQAQAKPHVVLVVGVNGNGKTTTIGKLSKQFKADGQKVMLCAADTFRAAAVEQLQVWGERNEVPVVTSELEADAASVAYRALEKAKAEKSDWLLIDTAGRLQNKSNLMAELEKIIRVLQKLEPDAPHSVLQVLDATTGQNAISQVETFKKLVGVTGLMVTKLDGSARAGVVVALAEKFGLPIHAIGVGEGIDDLRAFDAKEFARSLVGLGL